MFFLGFSVFILYLRANLTVRIHTFYFFYIFLSLEREERRGVSKGQREREMETERYMREEGEVEEGSAVGEVKVERTTEEACAEEEEWCKEEVSFCSQVS